MTDNAQFQLWMGSLEPYMTKTFIINAFRQMGENPLNVKEMRNMFTGEPARYCFIQFATDEEAIDVMRKLKGKPIPGTTPPVRFRLNYASHVFLNKIPSLAHPQGPIWLDGWDFGWNNQNQLQLP